jgi:hypothetical protein
MQASGLMGAEVAEGARLNVRMLRLQAAIQTRDLRPAKCEIPCTPARWRPDGFERPLPAMEVRIGLAERLAVCQWIGAGLRRTRHVATRHERLHAAEPAAGNQALPLFGGIGGCRKLQQHQATQHLLRGIERLARHAAANPLRGHRHPRRCTKKAFEAGIRRQP